MDAVIDDPTTRIAVDLGTLTVSAPSVQETFAFDDFRRWCLLEGFDDIDLTLRHTDEIAAYEAARAPWLPTA
jgi:3-isopropylmalate/(R)-2-methylmalate dehydratase small subunit